MAYDVIVLGGGPGGYLAAERAGAAGLRVLCIEDRHLGGTCLNEGCIPTKALLHSGRLFAQAKAGAACGVTAEKLTLDHRAVLERKDRIVRTLVDGVAATLRSCHVEVVNARGVLAGRTAEGHAVEAGGETYVGKSLILATGSSCAVPPIQGLQEGLASGFVMTNREILDMPQLPKRLAVLGGGVIGLEMATYFAMAGVETTVLEMLDHIGGAGDRELLSILQKNCEALGLKFLLGAKVTAVQDGCVVYEQAGQICQLPADRVLLSIGRRPNTDGIGLEQAGICTERGAVVTDERMRTNIPGIYAIGDINGKAMLAHTAYREAEVAVHAILGVQDRMRYDAIPSVLFTAPELSSVGMSEEAARSEGRAVKTVKIPMGYSGRYIVENERRDGVCKLVFDQATGALLGAQVLSDSSSEFIAAAAICIEMELTAKDMQEIVFPHPTVSEILREAACKYKG